MEQDSRALLPTQGAARATATVPVVGLQGPQGDSHQACSQEPHSPSSAEAPYCDLPCCPPAPQDPFGTTTCAGHSVEGLDLRQGPQRGSSPTAALPAEGSATAPRNRHQDPEALPYLEGLACSSCDNEGDNSDTSSSQDSSTPHETSNSSSVQAVSSPQQDWDTVERPGVVSNAYRLNVMIPRRPQEGLRVDSDRRVTKSPARGDTTGQRKEDSGSGGQSAGQHWAKLRAESGYFSLERRRAGQTQASSETPLSGPRTTTKASSAQRDVFQDASASETSQGPSLSRNTQRDTPRSPRTFSPSRVSQRDIHRTMSTQQSSTQLSFPLRATSESLKTSTPQDGSHIASSPCAQASSVNRTTQWNNPRTPCAQRDNPRTSSPNRTTQRDNLRTPCAQRDNPRTSSPNRTTQRDNPRTLCAQRDNPRTSSPNRTTQGDNPRTPCAQRDNPRTSSPNRTTQGDNPRTLCAQRDNPRTSSPNRTTQRDNPRTPCVQRDNPRSSSPNRTTQRDNPRTPCVQRDNPRTSTTKWDNPRTLCAQRDNLRTSSPACTQKDNPGPSSPRRATQGNSPRNPSPHRTNKDIPWASFPLRPTQSGGPRTSSPSRTKQNQVPWASISLRPTQGDRTQTSAPTKLVHHDPPQHYSPSLATSSHNPGHPSASRTSSPLYPARGAPETASEPFQPPCAVCIGHRDAPRASSPPRYFQYDPFPFFPDPRSSESESPHHEPPYMPPAVCIGHRDAPWATSPPRHAQFDPFPFLPDPDTSDAENESPQHDPPQFPPPVCIGYRDAPRASSPPRQFPEPSFFQDLPRASTESLVPSTDSLHEPPHIPTPVCIGHRDAPSFSSPPRQAPEPSLFFQDPPGTSMESLAPSIDSLHGSPLLPPQVCIGHRDAPRASSPPRHPPSDLGLLAPSPPPGSSGSRGSAPPGETRHNLEREEYTMLADLPPPRRLAQRGPEPQAQGSNEGRTRSPGRAEVERLFGQERRKSEAPGAFQAQNEGRSQRPSQGQSQLRRQSSPAPSRQVTKPSSKQAEPARRSQIEPPHLKSPEKRPEVDQRLQRTSAPARTSAQSPERKAQTERHLESGCTGLRQPLGGWQSQEELSRPQSPNRYPEKNWGSQEGPGLGGWPELESPSLEGIWRGPAQEHRERWGQSEAWELPPSNGQQGVSPRDQGSLQELSRPHQPTTPPDSSWAGPAECLCARQPEATTAIGWRAEGASPHQYSSEKPPDLDWRDLLGLLRAPEDGAWTRLPSLDWEGLLELLQARLPQKDPARASGPELGSPGTEETLKTEPPTQPEGWATVTQANGHSPGQRSESPAQLPSPACTSTQWPTTKVTSGPETSTLAALEQTDHLESHSPPDLAPEDPEASESSRGEDSLADQKQADSPDLLNFKKGWMSILDEPGEWKKHWFVLTDSSLKYYRDSTAEEADELDGEIDLRSCTDVTEYAVQRNYGFQIHTKDAIYTLSAMTSGIRRNWIEALRKTVRPTSAPDVTKLSDCNKENTLRGYGTQKGSLKIGEQRTGSEVIGRGGPRKVDGPRQSLDYVELSPLTPSSPQRVRTLSRSTPERPTKHEDLERDLAQRSEERRKWFESTDSRTPETPSGNGPRRGLGAPLTDDQQSRLSEEIEKKWQELEKLPLRENKRVPLTALLNQGLSEQRGSPSDSHEALEKEVQSLRAQLEAWRLRGEAPQNAPRPQDDSHIPPGYISQLVGMITVPILQTRPLSSERVCDLPEVPQPAGVRGGI
ncbi:TRIO and F-actin-binding protein [Lemmus lemmus]